MLNDTPRNRRIRSAVFMTSAVVAAGVGCYYGSKRGFKDIAAIAKQMQGSLDIVAIELSNISYHIDDEKLYRLNQIKNIDAAVKASVPFQHFPGLGVRFDSIADAEKVDAVLRAVPGVGTKK